MDDNGQYINDVLFLHLFEWVANNNLLKYKKININETKINNFTN